MKVLFYSNKCSYSKELIENIKTYNIIEEFKLIDVTNELPPDNIKVVPTIIDTNYNNILEGKNAFEYIFNQKYFDNSTNNILNWQGNQLVNPKINSDSLANDNIDLFSLIESCNDASVSDKTKSGSDNTTNVLDDDKKLGKIQNQEETKKKKISKINLLKIRNRG